MLTSLHIENIAVIRSADIDFSRGFSVLSGQTGAGKSLIIDSINFLLGRMAGRELLRTGADQAEVSAMFSSLSSSALLKLTELGLSPDEEGDFLLERRLNAEGKSSAKINGRPVNLSLLRSVGEALVNIHGQSATHALTSKESQREILDLYAEAEAELLAYREQYAAYTRVLKEKAELTAAEASREREIEMLRYQIEELAAARLKAGEEEKLAEEKKRIKSAERIAKQTSFVYRALKGGEKANAVYILEKSITALRSLADVVEDASSMAESLEGCLGTIQDVADRVYIVADDDGANASLRLDAIEARLDLLDKLSRRYKRMPEALISYLKECEERLSLLENAELALKNVNKQENILRQKTEEAAKRLHDKRAAGARLLADEILKVLTFLDMPKVTLSVDVAPLLQQDGSLLLSPHGGDHVELLLSANPGEKPQPLSKIASGGELSRIMLAIKSVINDKDGVDTVIYDEIDAGVSGKTARKIGISMLRSAKSTQVLCVSHSAQIASLADTHYLIEKKEQDGRVETEVSALDEEGRIKELSRILGGLEVTAAQKEAARELYAERSVYREE